MTPKTTSDLPLLPIGLMPLPQRRKIDKICLFVWYIPQKTVISQSVGHRKPSQVTKIDDMDKKEQILISISGIDHPGLTAQVMEILARHEAQILDIGQADIHSTLSLGILVRINEQASGQMMKELLFKSTELRVNIDFVPISDDEYEDWVSRQGKNRYILTVIGRELSARQIALATRVIAEQGLNIDSILRLTGRRSIRQQNKLVRACIEFSLRGTPKDRPQMQADLMRLSSEEGIDFSFQKDDMYRRMRRLICFDMDSTLIQTECIDELAERAGVGDKVKAITERAMRGEIDFKESFTERVALLKGLDASVMQDIAEHMPITEGVDRLMSVLKRCGYKIAILSGGFTYFGEFLQRKYGIDYVYANELEIDDDNKLTGRYVGEIVDGHRKAELLKLIAQVEKVNLAQTIAVGDGANDLPMISEAGLGIAFHAKPRVKANAEQAISNIGIDGVLYFLGFKDSYLGEQGKL
jgi:phosphoserine phosphatase